MTADDVQRLSAELERVWDAKSQDSRSGSYRLGYHAAIEDAKRVVRGGVIQPTGAWYFPAAVASPDSETLR